MKTVAAAARGLFVFVQIIFIGNTYPSEYNWLVSLNESTIERPSSAICTSVILRRWIKVG
jgi:hypothetical protein